MQQDSSNFKINLRRIIIIFKQPLNMARAAGNGNLSISSPFAGNSIGILQHETQNAGTFTMRSLIIE